MDENQNQVVKKKVTCRDMGGACDVEFEGTMDEVMKMGGEHLMSTTDEAHKPMRDDMTDTSKKEDQAKWIEWFKGVFDAK